MKTINRTKLIVSSDSQKVKLYEGKAGSWFMHRDEAEQHRVGYTITEALILITGSAKPRFLFATDNRITSRIYTKAFRNYLDDK